MNTQVPLPIAYKPKRSRSLRKRAKNILRLNGVRMGMVLATILFMTLWIISIYLVENTWYAIDWLTVYAQSQPLYDFLDILLYIADGLIVFFICLPLLYGWIRYMYLAATGVVPPYSILFTAFSSARAYFRSLGIVLLFILQSSLPLLLFGGAITLTYLCYIQATIWGYLLCPLCAIVGIALLILGTVANAGASLVFILDINHPSLPVLRLFRRAHHLRRGTRFQVWLLGLSFLPHVILGIISLGLSLLFHAIPLQFITVQRALLSITGESLPVGETVSSDR